MRGDRGEGRVKVALCEQRFIGRDNGAESRSPGPARALVNFIGARKPGVFRENGLTVAVSRGQPRNFSRFITPIDNEAKLTLPLTLPFFVLKEREKESSRENGEF